jgi:hypothetical protein
VRNLKDLTGVCILKQCVLTEVIWHTKQPQKAQMLSNYVTCLDFSDDWWKARDNWTVAMWIDLLKDLTIVNVRTAHKELEK